MKKMVCAVLAAAVFVCFGCRTEEENNNIPEWLLVDGTTAIGIKDEFKSTLSRIEIPEGITEIGNKFSSSPSHYILLESVVIPSSVTKIGDEAFSCCRNLKNVEIPASVTEIGEKAFQYCTSLENITIPSSVDWIGEEAFCGCDSLESVTISDGVRVLSAHAFQSCRALKTVYIPHDIWWIGDTVFEMSVRNILDVYYAGTKAEYNQSNWPSKIDSRYAIIYYIDEVENEWTPSEAIPEYLNVCGRTVKGIKSEFQKLVEDVCIPDGITAIDRYAFWYCTAIKRIIIPGSVTEIDPSVLSYDSSNITVYYGGTEEQWYNLNSGDFSSGRFNKVYNCSLKEGLIVQEGVIITYIPSEISAHIIIPEGVTEIGAWAFRFCKLLESIEISDGVLSIGTYAFGNCTSLKRVEISDSVSTIGSAAFAYCTSLETIAFSDSSDSILTIGSSAFGHCTSLKSIEIPNNVERIDDGTFFGCTALETVTISSDSILAIWDTAFGHCTSLKSIEIPNNVEWIGIGAFSGCTALETVTIPSSIKNIYREAFSDCRFLRYIRYDGTIDQWNNVDKGDSIFTYSVVISCSDGSVTM